MASLTPLDEILTSSYSLYSELDIIMLLDLHQLNQRISMELLFAGIDYQCNQRSNLTQ